MPGMKIGIISVMDLEYHPNRRLKEAANQKGYPLILLHPYRLWPEIREGTPGLCGEIEDWSMPDVVLPRQGATVGNSSLTLISHLQTMGVPLVNSLDAIRLSRNKFLTLQALSSAGIPVPDTLFVNSGEGLRKAVALLGDYPVVVKQVSGRQGKDVFLVDSERDVRSFIEHRLDKYHGLVVQRFIPPEGRKDIRILVIGEVVSGAMALRPKPGDFRANFHLTGEGRAVEASPELEETAVKAVRALGLEIGGVDLIMDQDGRVTVIEVNYSPGFKGLESATGLDIAGRIVDYAAETYEKR